MSHPRHHPHAPDLGRAVAEPASAGEGPTGAGGTPTVAGTVITVSDRCARGEAEDVSGPLAARLLADAGVRAEVVVVPDGAESVRDALRAALAGGARVVLTTGGTGVSPRDLTPEGTREVLTRELPGLAEAVRARGAVSVATAVLSRGLAGIATGRDGEALVVNAPGSSGAVRDTIEVLAPLLPHVLDQLAGGDHDRTLPI